MFKFLPTPALPGFRVGLADDDTPGFNVASDGSTQPVLPDAPDVPAVDDSYPFRANSARLQCPAGAESQSGSASRHRIAAAAGGQSNTDGADAVGRLPGA